jgi:MFS family permease
MAGFPAHAGAVTDHTRSHPDSERSLRLLILAGFASLTGDGIRSAALPLFTAISTHSPLTVSAVATAEVLPWLLVALPAGTVVDRGPPRTVVFSAHCLRSVAAAGLAAAVFTQHAGVPVLVASAFLLTTGETFADSAFQLLLVELSGRDRLDRANSWFVMTETLGLDLGGPLLAALLFAWQPGACFALDAGTFVLSAGFVSALPDVRVGAAGARRPLRQEIVAGTRFLLGTRTLRTLVTAVVASAVAVSAANAVVSLYAVDTLAVRPALVPTLWVAQALGTLFAVWLVPRLATRFGDGPAMVGSLALLGVAFVAVGAIQVAASVWVAYLLVGVGAGGWNVLSATRRQRLTPSVLMGRVTSAYRMLAWGLMPLGAALAGPLARITSLATVFCVVGAVVMVVAVASARPLARTGADRVER